MNAWVVEGGGSVPQTRARFMTQISGFPVPYKRFFRPCVKHCNILSDSLLFIETFFTSLGEIYFCGPAYETM